MFDTKFIELILSNKNQHLKLASGNLICPVCRKRTKLYTLKDSRRKCSVCLKKFAVKPNAAKIRKIALIVLGFALDFSALKTSRIYGLRYPDVLRFYHFIRYAMALESLGGDKLSGIVEADESCFGGVNRKRNKKYRKPNVGRGRGTDKTPVFGIKEREGKVWIDVPRNLTEEAIQGLITGKVEKGAKIMTDEFMSYKGLVCKGYIHRLVEHAAEEYARGPLHINGMENFWSWAKEKMIKFHGVFKPRFLFYLKELEWKFNNRKLPVEEQIIEIVKILPDNFLHKF